MIADSFICGFATLRMFTAENYSDLMQVFIAKFKQFILRFAQSNNRFILSQLGLSSTGNGP